MARKAKQKTVKQKIVKQKQTEAQPLMEWTVHMARKQPLKAAATIAIIASTIAVGWVWVHPLIAFLMGLFLLNAVGDFLFPIRYKVTEEGIEVSSFLRDKKVRWEQIRRLDAFRDSVFLSPYPKPSRLDNLRGVWLYWDSEPEGLKRLIQICQSRIQSR
jgi:hypothetical protein